MNLKLTNTLSKKKESFIPHHDGAVSMYVCGITPYDFSHIGHGRVYVIFDVLLRLLRFLGHKVTYIRNITDIDDKLINKALVEQNDIYQYTHIAEKFTSFFTQDMQQLNCLVPDYEPRVTQCIPEIIEFIQGLVAKKYAYVLDHDVYFDITTFADYGKLSGRKLDDLIAGARVDINEKKRHPGDFALWKGNNEHLYWQSPWGYGRPGWHIECSVMAKKHLGMSIDIHGGGMDLIFPHHENEIAQSETLHQKPFAKLWLHNAFVNINKEKMSKSLGNIVTLRNIFEQHDPMVLRYFYLQHHYRTPIDYAFEELNAIQTAYKKLISHLQHVSIISAASHEILSIIQRDQRTSMMLDALCDDLNTPKFLGIVFEHLGDYKNDMQFAALVKTLLQSVLGLTLQPLKDTTQTITPEIQALLDARQQARKEKNWQLADKIRDELIAQGYHIQDKKI